MFNLTMVLKSISMGFTNLEQKQYKQNIPKQFTVKAHPALFEGEGEEEGEGGGVGARKLRNTFPS